MTSHFTRSWLAALVLFGSSAVSFALEASKEEQVFSGKLVTALQKADFPAFIADGDATFQKLKKEQFAAVAAQLAPRLDAGYEISYLGELTQQGFHVTLWKLSFKDGKDDALATLSVKDGKIGGFWIK